MNFVLLRVPRALILAIAILLLATGVMYAQTSKPSSPTRGNVTPTPLVPPSQPTVGINLTLSPVFLNLTSDPGVPVTTDIKVTNNNNITEYLKIDLAKFQPDPRTGEPVLANLPKNDPFQDWISFSDPQFTIGPNETKTIKVTISPSKDAALGYYYALVVSRIKEKNAGKEQAVVAGAPAMPVLLEIRSPNAKREVQLLDFKTDKSIYEYLPVTFDVIVKNTGNVHLAPSGDIFIDQGGKQNIGILQVNPTQGNVLPNTTRTYQAVWDDSFATYVPKMDNGKPVKNSKGDPVYTAKYDFAKADRFRIGKYTARVLLVYDNGERDVPVEAKISFWVIPWKILLAGLVIIVFILLGIRSILGGLFRKRS